MKTKLNTIDEFISSLPEERKSVISELRKVISKNIPKGFEETISYGMIGYVVPHSLYPSGYHCDPKLPLPFICIASQKNHISIHHMGLYDKKLEDWFLDNWKKYSDKKADLGKCCIRFKKPEDIPMKLIAEMVKKMNPNDWIKIYETNFISNKKKK